MFLCEKKLSAPNAAAALGAEAAGTLRDAAEQAAARHPRAVWDALCGHSFLVAPKQSQRATSAAAAGALAATCADAALALEQRR